MKVGKKRKEAEAKYDNTKSYTLLEASNILKQISSTKFDASVDIDVRLGVDPRQANQMVRGVASLPHGLGKVVRTLVLCTSDKEQEARDAGADHVGLDDYIEKIAGGWTDIDIIIAVQLHWKLEKRLLRLRRVKSTLRLTKLESSTLQLERYLSNLTN